mgnify:FL=1
MGEIKSKPFEQGGDPTAESWISIADKQISPVNLTAAFFSGNDRSILTWNYASWMGNNYISVPDVEIKGIWNWNPTTRNPWGKEVKVRGSDAGQFHPFIENKTE